MQIDTETQNDEIERIVDDVELEGVAGGDAVGGKGNNTGVEG